MERFAKVPVLMMCDDILVNGKCVTVWTAFLVCRCDDSTRHPEGKGSTAEGAFADLLNKLGYVEAL